MTTPEQQARTRAYEKMAQNQCQGAAIQGRINEPEQELANLIAERDALKAELAAIKGAGEPVAWSVTMNGAHTGNICGDQQEAIDLMNSLNHNFPFDKRAVAPLYTRPCVPLTDEPELLEALKRLSFAAQTTGGVAGRDEGLCAAIDAAAAVIAKVVAHTKGAKP